MGPVHCWPGRGWLPSAVTFRSPANPHWLSDRGARFSNRGGSCHVRSHSVLTNHSPKSYFFSFHEAAHTWERKPVWGGQVILPLHFTVGESEDQRERERALPEVTEFINGRNKSTIQICSVPDQCSFLPPCLASELSCGQ